MSGKYHGSRERRERLALALSGWRSVEGPGDKWEHPETRETHEREDAIKMVLDALQQIGRGFAKVARAYEDAAVEELREDLDKYELRG